MRVLGLFERLEGRGRAPREVALAIATGAAAAYSHPGIGLSPVMPVALIALSFWAARARSFWGAARVGIAFGVGIFWVITIGSQDWAWLVPVALTLVGTTLYALPQALWARALARRPYDVAAFCATAGAWSLVMEAGDCLGFPTKGEGLAALAGMPELMGGARLLGCNLICGIMIAGTLGCGLRLAQSDLPRTERARYALRPLGAALALLALASGAAHLTAPRNNGTLEVGIPQMNVPSGYFEHRLALPELSEAFEDVFDAQLRELGSVDLLVLSETYDGSYPLQVPRLRQRFQNYARLQQQGVLLSSYLMAPDGGIYNAVGSIDPTGRLVGVHRKVDLAPFGEVEFEAGSRFRATPILPGVRVGVLICQESLLSDGPRALAIDGANLLVSPTSDISFGSGLLGFEHLALARMRAIETGRALVWASAGGPSGSVDRWGHFTAAGPFRAPAAVKVSVALHDEQSPYLRSAWFWRALAASALLLLFVRKQTTPVPLRVTDRDLGTVRGLSSLAAALLFCAALSVGSAAAVEVRNGTPARAMSSALELVRASVRNLGPRSLARFRTDSAHSASGAVAYYLGFYGRRVLPSAESTPANAPSLSDLAEALRRDEGFPSHVGTLNLAALPRVASIVRSKAGEYYVMTSDRARRIWLFSPIEAAVRQLDASQAKALLEPLLLQPDRDPELGSDVPAPK